MSGQGEADAVRQQMQKIGISAEHHTDVHNINKYLKEHKVNQLFNVSARF